MWPLIHKLVFSFGCALILAPVLASVSTLNSRNNMYIADQFMYAYPR